MYGIGILLLSIVAGYWLLERAHKHKGGLKRIGQILGVLVIVLSICGIAYKASVFCGKNKCYYKKGTWSSCPLSGKTLPSQKK